MQILKPHDPSRQIQLCGCVPGTAHVLRVSLQFLIMEVKASPKPSQMEAKGIVLSQRGYPVAVPRKAVVLLKQSNTKARGDEQKSSQACMSGTSPAGGIKTSIHYKQCPYTRRLRDERRVLNSPPSPTSRYFSIPFLSRFSIRYQSDV